jgi:hypothetical protein
MSQPTLHPDLLTPIQRANFAVSNHVKMKDICEVDGKVIKVMCFKGTGVCGEICRKIRDKEPLDRPQAISNR